MKPTTGRISSVNDIKNPSNGVSAHPGIVARVWHSDDPADGGRCCVNATVLPDCGAPRPASSIDLYETKEDAMASGTNPVAWWPDRSPAVPATEMRSEADLPPETQEIVSTSVAQGGSAVGYGDSAEG